MKIAIAGYGVEGKANFDYFSRDPANELTIVDEQASKESLPRDVPAILGPNAFSQLDGFDLVIRTAGLAPYKITTNGKIWSATNEFFARCPAPIIGVTGSKGKGTTSSLITAMLEATGRKVWLVGNIGTPALETLDRIQAGDIVVYELSSFQLWDIERSPETAVVLFIEREHMDVHRSMEEYVEAKAGITRFQKAEDLLIYHRDNPYAASIAAGSAAAKIGYPDQASAHIREGNFFYGEQLICSTGSIQLRGAHNLENAVAAIDAVWRYTQDTAAIESGLTSFKGLPHRLAFVRRVNDVDYYDDSIATTPSSAIAALRAFPGAKVLILGGSDKGSDFSELATELTKHDVKVLLMGEQAEAIAQAASAAGFTGFEIVPEQTMDAIVRRASELASPGSTVLLSPACASFGLFQNYADRGDQFIAAVNQL